MLEVATEWGINYIWIGRDLGYRGGRRTGLPFTDDAHIHEHAERWELSIQRPTKGEVVAERTADVIRHPSYGGQTRFCAQMNELYDLPGSGA